MKVRSTLFRSVFVTTLAATGCAVAPVDERPATDDGRAVTTEAAITETPTANCAALGGGSYDCTNRYKRALGYSGYMTVDNLSAYQDQKAVVRNTGKEAVTVASVQGLNVHGKSVKLEPGDVTTLSRIDGITPFFGVLLFSDAPQGTAHIRIDVISRLGGEATPTANCVDAGGGAFRCKNDHRRGLGYAGFLTVDNLSAWSDEKAFVKNTGNVVVRVVSQQGLNAQSKSIELVPGASTTLSRIDAITPFWSVLMYTDAPLGKAEITVIPR